MSTGVLRVPRVPRVFPPFPLWILVKPQDRATQRVLDRIIWYQQPLVSADLTFHPPDLPSNFFSKKYPKNSPKLPLDGSTILLSFEWFCSVDLVLLVSIYYFPHLAASNSSISRRFDLLGLVWGRTRERKFDKSG